MMIGEPFSLSARRTPPDERDIIWLHDDPPRNSATPVGRGLRARDRARAGRTLPAGEVRRCGADDNQLLSRQGAAPGIRTRRHLGRSKMREELLDLRSLDARRAWLGVSRPARQSRTRRLLRARRQERILATPRSVPARAFRIGGRSILSDVPISGPDPRPQGADRIRFAPSFPKACGRPPSPSIR